MVAATDQLFIDHVHELRRRLLVCVSCMLLAAGAAYLARDALITAVIHPLHQSLIYTAPSGGLQFLLQVCLTVGLIVALPIFVYNLLSFVRPAFDPEGTKRTGIVALVATSYALALAGIVFAYLLVLPLSFHFFAGFDIGGVKALISTSEYLSFVLGCLVTFAAIFQLPLLLLSYNHINRFPPGTLTKYRRHVLIGSLAIAVVLPFTYDPLTQLVIALPVIVLYEASVLTIWVVNRRQGHSPATANARTANPAPGAPVPDVSAGGSIAPSARAALAPTYPTAPRPTRPVPNIPIDGRRPIQLG